MNTVFLGLSWSTHCQMHIAPAGLYNNSGGFWERSAFKCQRTALTVEGFDRRTLKGAERLREKVESFSGWNKIRLVLIGAFCLPPLCTLWCLVSVGARIVKMRIAPAGLYNNSGGFQPADYDGRHGRATEKLNRSSHFLARNRCALIGVFGSTSSN